MSRPSHDAGRHGIRGAGRPGDELERAVAIGHEQAGATVGGDGAS